MEISWMSGFQVRVPQQVEDPRDRLHLDVELPELLHHLADDLARGGGDGQHGVGDAVLSRSPRRSWRGAPRTRMPLMRAPCFSGESSRKPMTR